MRKFIVGVFVCLILGLLMAKVDLSPKMTLKPAEQELVREYIPGERPLGETIGGLQAFASVFKRGYGDKVFGSDENGIWLGGSDFENAPFTVDMNGNLILDGTNSKIILYDSSTGLPSIVIEA